MTHIQIIDSHTGGEPTRVVIAGGPPLEGLSALEARERFRGDYDHYRSAIVNEPRGSDVVVGALLLPPTVPECVAGVVFFNNVGYLGMCGHGTIGIVETLRHLGKIEPGWGKLETPVGVVDFELREDGFVHFANVPARRTQKLVPVQLPGKGTFRGDVAWGGNWFYLVYDHQERIEVSNAKYLSDLTVQIMEACAEQGIAGDTGPIDHVELFAAPTDPARADSKNFVMCPGGAYDRSPCGTGTSAKLACLYADGKLKDAEVYRQESFTGSIFEGWVELREGEIIPHIAGRAFVTAKASLLIDPLDNIGWGIR